MKFRMQEDFYKSTSIFSRFFLYSGFVLVHIGMKLSGFDDGDVELETDF